MGWEGIPRTASGHPPGSVYWPPWPLYQHTGYQKSKWKLGVEKGIYRRQRGDRAWVTGIVLYASAMKRVEMLPEICVWTLWRPPRPGVVSILFTKRWEVIEKGEVIIPVGRWCSPNGRWDRYCSLRYCKASRFSEVWVGHPTEPASWRRIPNKAWCLPSAFVHKIDGKPVNIYLTDRWEANKLSTSCTDHLGSLQSQKSDSAGWGWIELWSISLCSRKSYYSIVGLDLPSELYVWTLWIERLSSANNYWAWCSSFWRISEFLWENGRVVGGGVGAPWWME